MHGSQPNLMRRSQLRTAAVLAAVFCLTLPAAYLLRDAYAATILRQAGELLATDKIASRQQASQALYGSALFEDDTQYKLDLVRERRPEILALGSSRALQFRSEFFRVEFANAGRAMNAIEHGAAFVDELLKVHTPRTVIMTVDLWWLNDARKYKGERARRLEDTSKLTSTFWGFVNDRKITKLQTVQAFLGDLSNPISSRSSIGIAALARGRGYRPDGSRDYGDRYFGLDASFDDVRFETSMRRARRGGTLLSHGETISREHLTALENLLQRFRLHNVSVIVVLPPLAAGLLDYLNASGKFRYMDEARQALRQLSVPVFDFTDPRTLDARDCEFADALHAGDIIYQRMLAEMTSAGLLRDEIDLQVIKANIANYAGHALTPMPDDGYKRTETDFLQIGCVKTPRTLIAP